MSVAYYNPLIIEELEIEGLDVEFYIVHKFISNQQEVYEELKNTIPFKQETSIVFGKEYLQKRLQCLLGEESKTYTYAGIERHPEPMTDTLTNIMNKVQKIVQTIDKEHPKYTSVLSNYYRDGQDKIDKHSDNEKDLIKNSIISSVSLGSDRDFDIYDKSTNKRIKRITLKGGSLLLMGRNSQKKTKHAIPQQKEITEGRINLTYRAIKE